MDLVLDVDCLLSSEVVLNTYDCFGSFRSTHERAKFETEGSTAEVYLLTCNIMRGKRLELTRKGGKWSGREWEWSGRRGSGQCDYVCAGAQ